MCMTLIWATSTLSHLVVGSAGFGGPVLRSAKTQKCRTNVHLYDRGRDIDDKYELNAQPDFMNTKNITIVYKFVGSGAAPHVHVSWYK